MLEELARTLATQHQTVNRPGSLGAFGRKLVQHEKHLWVTYRSLVEDSRTQVPIPPAGFWLLDNFTLILDQLREIREDLPQGYYQKLPKLTGGPLAGTPRVYALSQELLGHTDTNITSENLLRFVQAYQEVTPLTMGELWAVAIMLRFGLIESLGILASQLLEDRQLRLQAGNWAELLLKAEEENLSKKESVRSELLKKYPHFPPAFAVEIMRRLQDYEGDAQTETPFYWLEQHLNNQTDSNFETLTRLEKQNLATTQATTGNIITSMRMLTAFNWPEWFENVSQVDQILGKDPALIYSKCTFATRDRYRHEVEQLARNTGYNEITVAWQLIELAKTPWTEGAAASHLGYYLIGKGRKQLEARLSFKPGLVLRARRAILRHPTPFYLGAAGVGTAGLVAAGLKFTGAGFRRPGSILAAGLLLVPATEVSLEIVNWGLTRLIKPRVLPKLDFSKGIPADQKTIVVIPMLLLTPQSMAGLFDRLEVLYLANRDPHLHFALLSDFADANEIEMPEDNDLLTQARTRVEALNLRYGSESFLFFHRRRIWNPAQACYMGWERKRGKIEEFNRLLVGAQDTSFEVQLGEISLLPKVRYVITLDADTQLPRDSAKTLIGTMAHPLNTAVIDPLTRLVIEGYGILQPRNGIDLTSATRSRFASLFSGNVGLDPYTSAISNVYMDLFGEGIYAGKGIYDPEVMRLVLEGRFPENRLLSHDLIEGNYARTGFLSDVELLDNFPSSYSAYAARIHRWIRGDWQILAWVRGRVPTASGALAPNNLPVIARFKIFDNLRRSLVSPAVLVLIVAGFLILPGSALAWAGIALFTLALPNFFSLLNLLLALPRSRDPLARLIAEGPNLGQDILRFAVNLAFLAERSLTNLDAIGRTLYRLCISKRNLLEWETAEEAQGRLNLSRQHLLKQLAPAFLPGVLAFKVSRLSLAKAWKAGSIFIAGWAGLFGVIRWLGRPLYSPPIAIATADKKFLRQLARSYWHYFETFVTPEGNYLAPDNFQEDPGPVIAYRTSPTNIGLQLSADLAGYDFGYIDILTLTSRTEQVFLSMAKLEKFRGHFLNWYNTRTLQTLPPSYISMVDSGNLAGCLLTLRQAYLDFQDKPLISPACWSGLTDTMALLIENLVENERSSAGIAAICELLRCVSQTSTPTSTEYLALFIEVKKAILALNLTGEAQGWSLRCLEQVDSFIGVINTFLPWINETPSTLLPELNALYGPPLTINQLLDLTGEALAKLGESSAGGEKLPALLRQGRQKLVELQKRHLNIATLAFEQVRQMDFKFLYDEKRKLFSIGYFVTEGRADNSYYDLLASEARLGSFIAIAKDDIPQEHWFHLGRSLVRVGAKPALVSWSGTMFEYLMPLLFMRSYPQTLLDQTYKVVVERQVHYGRLRKVPWGISESAFSARDLNQNYQYQAFGVPELGLKPGLGSNLVIAPYATFLGLNVLPSAAIKNIRTLEKLGLKGVYGYYDAVDFTAERVAPGKTGVVVRSYMVHHQGMSLLALNNFLNQNIMQDRFHSEPIIQATQSLLQEQLPGNVTRRSLSQETPEFPQARTSPTPLTREFTTAHTAVPYTHLLSNGVYSVVITNSGSGYSRYKDLAITRWKPDITSDNGGTFCYIKDARSGLIWSAAYQPTCHEAQDYRVVYSLHKAGFFQLKAGLETRMDVTVSPEDNAEIRHFTLRNLSLNSRELEITSYAEIVLNTVAADNAHPAFSKLFVETEYLPFCEALLASRRPRSPEEQRIWAVHVLAVRGHKLGKSEYETSRANFLGRGHSAQSPEGMQKSLTNTTGTVIDPIFSLRQRVRVVPGGTVDITFTTAIAETRAEALLLAAKFHDPTIIPRVFDLAQVHSQVELRNLMVTATEVNNFQRLAGRLIYPDAWLRAAPEILAGNRKGQSGLWAYGISGDFPIILVEIITGEELSLLRELLKAYQYYRVNNLAVDLVILNRETGGYNQGLQDQVFNLIHNSSEGSRLNQRGGIFILQATKVSEEDITLLKTVARGILYGSEGDLARQLRLRRPGGRPDYLPSLPATAVPVRVGESEPEQPGKIDLQMMNEYGGFTPDGKEYVIELKPSIVTPAPWINVLANDHFGCLVTERGSSYTWSGNSRENRLTPWSNDPVSDPSGEALYLRDNHSNAVWSPTPQPSGKGYFRVRHGFGYTSFENRYNEIASKLDIFVDATDPVKIYRLRLQNLASTGRNLSATFFAEWTLGVFREEMAPYVVTGFDGETNILLATNFYNSEYGERVAFVAGSTNSVAYTCDRNEFIGRNGSMVRPSGLGGEVLSGRVGSGLDPCAALEQFLELAPGEEREIFFLLGEGADLNQVRELVNKYRGGEGVGESYRKITEWWQGLLGKVQVQTPFPQFDVLHNGWLLYQTLACRIWARSAFYQSGGAYGFRDQLQDVMALSHAAPHLIREHILRAAQRQFGEGDVQHWWHPPTGRGTRTNFSDDFLWLPFATHFYIISSGDTGVLDEKLSFLEGRPLEAGEAEYYDTPTVSNEQASLYEHCVRAIEYALGRFGPHGLPLMGSGDWNDGMNLVGTNGPGESIWVGWFLYLNLVQIAQIASKRGDHERAARFREEARLLQLALEEHGWDGEWYLRAYFDDGSPLGSRQNTECRIDSLVQSWAVISGAGSAERAELALKAVEQYLVDQEAGIIKLFTPAFSQENNLSNPGYIKGYPEGLRENGGQYTHAALWFIWACAMRGKGARVGELSNLINPINHALTNPDRYMVEPYVLAADVYSVPPHTGQGGWTWYTGSAGWFYRLGLEMLLGLRLEGNFLRFEPCIPPDWKQYKIDYRFGKTVYHITITNPRGLSTGVSLVKVNGNQSSDGRIALEDDGQTHQVIVELI